MTQTTLPGAGVSRRGFLKGTAAACLAGAALPGIHPRLAFGTPQDPGRGDVLVFVELRGGMDGLSAVVPAGDAGYYRNRSTIAVPDRATIPLDGRFGMHPAMRPLAEVYRAGDLAVVTACGSSLPTRSHFVQQDLVDRGTTDKGTASGWLGRHLAMRPLATPSVQAASMSARTTPVMAGAPVALAMPDLAAFGLHGLTRLDTPEAAATKAALSALAGDGAFGASAGQVLATLDVLGAAQPAAITPANGATYPADQWGLDLRQVAQLIRAGVGLEAAVVELGGWDTHIGMGTAASGTMRRQLERLATSLYAFYLDTLDVRDHVTVVVLSEFGRRVAQNGGGGTDHGRGGVAFVMGGGVRGGVYGAWPGLDPSALDQGDVPVTTDFRSVVSEVLQHRVGTTSLADVFPGFTPAPLGLVDPR